DRLVIEMQDVGFVLAGSCQEQIVQIDPMELNIRRAVLALVLRRQRERLDGLSRVMQTEHVRVGPHAGAQDCILEIEVSKDVHGVGAELNARANLAENGSLLVDFDVETLAHEAARGSQTANARSGYQDFSRHPHPELCALTVKDAETSTKTSARGDASNRLAVRMQPN